jgi:hypothetical protein
MKYSKDVYLSLIMIFLLSFLLASFLPMGDIFKGVAASPALAALVMAIYQVFKDQANHERAMALADKNNFFSLGVASHMAKVAFDKHVEFCEKYIKEMNLLIQTFYREGPTTRGFEHVSKLWAIEKEYAAWIPKEMSSKLKPFTDAIWKISCEKDLADDLRESSPASRQEAIEARERARKTFNEVFRSILGKEQPSEQDCEVALQRLRDLLGIDQLTKMRSLLIESAIKSIDHA